MKTILVIGTSTSVLQRLADQSSDVTKTIENPDHIPRIGESILLDMWTQVEDVRWTYLSDMIVVLILVKSI